MKQGFLFVLFFFLFPTFYTVKSILDQSQSRILPSLLQSGATKDQPFFQLFLQSSLVSSSSFELKLWKGYGENATNSIRELTSLARSVAVDNCIAPLICNESKRISRRFWADPKLLSGPIPLPFIQSIWWQASPPRCRRMPSLHLNIQELGQSMSGFTYLHKASNFSEHIQLQKFSQPTTPIEKWASAQVNPFKCLLVLFAAHGQG